MINFTKITTAKIWRIYTASGCPQGYFLEGEKEMADRYAESIGGFVKVDYIYYYG